LKRHLKKRKTSCFLKSEKKRKIRILEHWQQVHMLNCMHDVMWKMWNVTHTHTRTHTRFICKLQKYIQ